MLALTTIRLCVWLTNRAGDALKQADLAAGQEQVTTAEAYLWLTHTLQHGARLLHRLALWLHQLSL
jgi:hypothetical protein